jgi:peptide/nickel transport system ATP-binding protein
MSAEPLLEVENLHTTFETDQGRIPAVDGVSFEIKPGEIFGIVGESGSGKSVTARSIMRLIEENGTIEADTLRFKGEDLLAKNEAEMRQVRGAGISMIFQDSLAALNPVITNGEQIAESVRHQTDTGESRSLLAELKRKFVTGTSEDAPSWQRAIELLESVGMPDAKQRAREYPHQLSGGMRQRVMIAQALAGNPALIIADEPTTALDVSIEAQILNEMLDLRDEFQMSVLLISHDIGVIRETCDRGLVMYAGEVMETGPIEDLINQPKHPYTRALVDSAPQLDEDREWLKAIEGTIPELIDKPSGCPFRDRCEHAFEACTKPLEDHQLASERLVRCHLYTEDGKGGFDYDNE